MASYQTFTTVRTTIPDPATLDTAVQSAISDPTAAILLIADTTWKGKKATAWTAPQITAVQNALDTAPARSPQLLAQTEIDHISALSLREKALLLLLLDQINQLRQNPTTVFAAIAVQAALDAWRTKAGQIS